MESLKLVYIANTIVAGWISFSSLFSPVYAQHTIFGGSLAYSEAIRLVGALWGGIFTLSVLGLWYPFQMSPVLLLQLIYKSVWLLFVAVPAQFNHKPYPTAMALFFVIWVIVLPFVIPWKQLFRP